MLPSPITSTVDFEAEGVQHGYLKMPHSRDESAWGTMLIPITVIKNGTGPSALLTGANHGDEYEGPLALSKLANNLRGDEITGRVIILPFMNYPAFRAGKRVSPLDGGNMNRSFPGRPEGSFTQKIADYMYRHLLPLSDYVLDIHSGGKSMQLLPFVAAHVLDDKAQQARCVAAMEAFAAPYHLMLVELDSVGMYDNAAEALGKTFITTELGGGGSVSPYTLEIAETGVHNLLVHAGIKHGERIARNSVRLDMSADNSFVTSEHDGLLEMCVGLGEPVCSGQVVARIYDPSRTGGVVQEYRAGLDGILALRHFPGLVQAGDAIALIAVPQPHSPSD